MPYHCVVVRGHTVYASRLRCRICRLPHPQYSSATTTNVTSSRTSCRQSSAKRIATILIQPFSPTVIFPIFRCFELVSSQLLSSAACKDGRLVQIVCARIQVPVESCFAARRFREMSIDLCTFMPIESPSTASAVFPLMYSTPTPGP